MRKLSKEERPTYVLSYPRPVRLVRLALVVLLTVAALVRWVLAWVHFGVPVVESSHSAMQAGSEIGPALAQALAVPPLRPLVAAHLGLILAAGAVAFVYAFLPDLALVDTPGRTPGAGTSLAVRLWGGWRVIPWERIAAVRIASFAVSKRRLVLVQGKWTRGSPWPHLVSLCLGAGFEPGLLFTSDLRDFKPLVRRLYDEVRHANPDALFDDEFFSLPARLVLEPGPTLEDLLEQARDEGWPLAISAQAMGAVPAGLVLVYLLLLVLYGGAWWSPIVVIGLCELEWLLGAFYLFALAEFFPVHVEFQEALLLYPLAQVPRALLAVLMALFVAAGVPALAAVAGLVGVLWAVILTTVLVQRMFRLKSMLPAAAGAAVQALYQFMILALVLTG
jgi:hypothetical protein